MQRPAEAYGRSAMDFLERGPPAISVFCFQLPGRWAFHVFFHAGGSFLLMVSKAASFDLRVCGQR